MHVCVRVCVCVRACVCVRVHVCMEKCVVSAISRCEHSVCVRN